MMVKRTLLAGLAGIIALAALTGALIFHDQAESVRGQARQRQPASVALAYQSRGRLSSLPAARRGAHALAYVASHAAPASISHAGAARVRRDRLEARAAQHSRHIVLYPPRAPLHLAQIGGLEPAGRVLLPGAWINSTTLTVVVRMASPMAPARLQPQVELRPASQPFTGRPTATGPAITYRGRAVAGTVRIRGLRNGVAYHWRVRVHDTRGPSSAWVALPGAHGATLRVDLAAPAAPRLALVTPAQGGNWIATRLVTLRWSPPAERSGIRGYSFTLSRSPLAGPALHLRTALQAVTVRARGEGLWYFTVRALTNAHSWGPPARLAVRIETSIPRLRVLAVPRGAVNPRRAHPLLRLALTQWSRIIVEVVARDGRVVRSIPTHLHRPGYHLNISWDGLATTGRLVPNGRYTLRITATGRAGRTWQTTRPLDVLAGAPAFVSYGLVPTNSWYPSIYNPYNNDLDGTQDITLALDAPARVRIEALHGGRVMRTWLLTEPSAGAVITATWDGTTAGDAMPPGGIYTFRAVAVDAAGNTSTANLGSLTLDHRRIVVSLDAQQLWALDGNRVLLTTYVTTGGPELPTPTGDFQIIDRESPFTFHSPYPPSSPYWYKDSTANFAMLFQWNGYFLHDAPWRSVYGPGSNSVDGTPGTNYTGTHGCVNVPYYPMVWLFNWATMFTPVQVRQHWTPG